MSILLSVDPIALLSMAFGIGFLISWIVLIITVHEISNSLKHYMQEIIKRLDAKNKKE